MAVYASVTDYIQQFSIDLTGTADYPISAEDQQKTKSQISKALTAASAEVSLYVSGLNLPSDVVAYLKYATCVIARKAIDLYTDREKVRSDYEDVIQNLCKLAEGKFKVPINRVYVGDRAVGVSKVEF